MPIVDSSTVDTSAEPLQLCLRLDDPTRPGILTELTNSVRKEYFRLLYLDCDVGLAVRPSTIVPEFANDLIDWNFDFWGCRQSPTTKFGLVRKGTRELTSADAARLIDHYLEAATLVLSPECTRAA